MKIRMLTLTVALMALPATTTFADVDCQMIMQELKAGRTPQGVVNGHRINENDIKVCQAEADREAWQARMRGNDSVPDGSAAMPELPKNVDDRAK
jgi:hypothetical protein